MRMQRLICRCGHRFTLHNEQCDATGCLCPHFIHRNSRVLIVEHENQAEIVTQRPIESLYKEKPKVAVYTCLNPFLKWDDKAKRWRCRACNRSDKEWVKIRDHVHPKWWAKIYGIKVKKNVPAKLQRKTRGKKK